MHLEEAKRLAHDLTIMKNADGRNAKMELAKGWKHPYHKEFLELVGNDKRQWFTTWATVLQADPAEEGLDLDEILYAAEHRLATPSTTAERIQDLLAEGWPVDVLRAVVDKKFDAGITIASFKKVLGARKVWQPALCADWLKMSDKKRTKLLTETDYYSTPKMDGLRCIMKLHTDDRGCYSRTLKPLHNMEHMLEALESMIDFPCHVDGEVFAADGTWNSSMTGVKKKGAKIPLLFYPFDLVPREEVDSQEYLLTARERWDLMDENIDYGEEDMFCRVHHHLVKTVAEVEHEHREDVAAGWEGSVLHDANATYACKRSNAWIKVKQFHSSEFTVAGVCPGTGKHLGRLGAIIIKGAAFDGTPITAEVGTGFKDHEREAIWSDPDSYIGRSAEIKYFEVTDASLRFPVFLRFRDEE